MKTFEDSLKFFEKKVKIILSDDSINIESIKLFNLNNIPIARMLLDLTQNDEYITIYLKKEYIKYRSTIIEMFYKKGIHSKEEKDKIIVSRNFKTQEDFKNFRNLIKEINEEFNNSLNNIKNQKIKELKNNKSSIEQIHETKRILEKEISKYKEYLLKLQENLKKNTNNFKK